MKKRLIIISFLMLLLPLSVNAVSIDKVDVQQIPTQIADSYFKVPITVHFSAKQPDEKYHLIDAIAFGIQVDSSLLEITNADSKKFETDIINSQDGIYYIISAREDEVIPEYNGNGPAINDFTVDVTFHLKSANAKITNINILAVVVEASEIDDENKVVEMTYEKVITERIPIYQSDLITVPDEEETTVKAPTTDISKDLINKTKENTPSSSTTSSSSTSSSSTKKEPTISSNNYLKTLWIENQILDFNKDKLEYEITIDDSIKILNIKAEPEDSKSTVEIIGNDPLTNEVKVNVKAENGVEKIYNIKVNKQLKDNQSEKQMNKTFKKVNLIIILSVVVLIIIVVISIIIKVHNNRKLDKMMKEL